MSAETTGGANFFWFVLSCRSCSKLFTWSHARGFAECRNGHRLIPTASGWWKVNDIHSVRAWEDRFPELPPGCLWGAAELERVLIDHRAFWKRARQLSEDVRRARSQLVEVSSNLRPTFRPVWYHGLPTQFELGEAT